MSNIYDFTTDFDPSTMARVASAQDANPDQAARAVELAQATGAPAGAIYQNVDEYNDQLKTQMGADIVRRNRALRSYVDSHPLAAAVSNDDWAEMDDASKAAAAVGQEGVFKRFVGGFKEGFGPQFLGSWETGIPQEGSDWLDTLQKRQAYAEAHPIAGAIAPLAALFGAPIEVPGRAVAGAVLGTSRALGLDDSSLQALADPGFWASMGPVGEAVGTFFKGLQTNAQMRGEMRAIAPFLGQGELPPVGAHPETDKIHAAQAEADKEALSEALKTSAATATRERSPELYQKLMEQVVQGTIGINSDAVRELYKEKEPAPDDGILGWVPGIRDQLEAPGDISVPLADYLAKVDPAIAKGLEDHVRLRPDGMTIEEVKGIEAYHGTPHEFEAFDTSKIGTGEGAQSFGHGIYLAQSPETAKFYSKTLSGKSDNIVEELANQELMYNNNDREAAAKALIDRAEGEEKESFSGISADSMRKAADLVTSGWSPKSFLYKARIRRGEEEFLDWDKPLSEQPKAVQNFVRDQGIVETNLGEPAHVSGEKIYQAVKDKLTTHKKLPPDENGMYRIDDGREAASHALYEAGIPGIKYLDQGSRDIGGGTRNFVVFNDKDLEIIERNGEKVQGDRTQKAVNTLRQSSGLEASSGEIGEPPKAAPEIAPSRPFTASPGITKKQTELYYKAMDKRTAEDQAKLEARVVADQRRRQTAEWKVEEAKVRETVSNEIYNDPTVRLFDHLHEGRFTLNADDLSPEQLSALPAKWVRKAGLENAALSDALGVRDITPVLSRLAEIEHNRGTEKPKDFIEGMIDDETDRRMEATHGDLSRNIISEARDQVLSETQEEMLHEQTRALAEQAGVDYTISKADIKSMVKDHFDTLTASEVSSSKFLAQAGRHGRAMEDAFLKKDVHEAFRQSGAQQVSFMLGREAAKLEKVRAQTERLMGAYASREVKGRDQQFTNAIHAILQKVGAKIGRSPTDLAREFEETGFSGLAHFISERDNDYAVAGFKIPIADFLLDDGYKTKVDQMPVHEWQGFAQTVKALDHLSRDWDKVNRQGEKVDRAAWISAATEQLKERFDVRPFDERDKTKFLKKFAKNVIADFHSMATVFYRFDGRDPNGLFIKMFIYPGAEGANYEAALQRETSKRYRELGAIPKPKQALDHDFIDPMTGEKWVGLTRANLEAIVANIGNKYNLDRIAFTLGKGATDQKGRWVSDIPDLMQWIEENTSKEDIDRAQARGKIFADLKEGSDTVYRNLYGIAPENIELRPFEMHGKEYPGWYHPIIQDEERALQDHAKAPNAETNPTNFWPTTPNGYMQRRTGAFERLSLNDSMVPIKFNQIIHDASMKSFVYEASKIINDRGFRQGITKYYGKEYHDAIKSWLWRIAGSASYDPTSLAGAAYYSNLLRQNVISTYIGFNLGTVLKHGPTAFVASAKEVGPINQLTATARVVPSMMANAVRGLFGQDPALGNSLWQFIWNNSESIQRRDRNWAESTGGVQDILYGKSTLRNRIIQWGSKAVALSDMLSAAPLWLAKYEEVLGETGIHGDAVNQANFAVDRIHGSTSTVHTPNIAAGGGVLAPWFTSLYGYFGANMQRKIEIMHDMNDTYKLARDGEITAAAKTIPGITTSILAQMMWPALIEEWVQSQHTEDHRGYLGRAASFLIQALSNSILGVRDLSWALTHDESNPSAGLITSLYQDIINPIRDFKKPHPLNRQSAGKVVQDSLTAIGDLSGVSPKPVARAVRYGIDVHSGVQHPHSVGDWYRGLTAGQQKKRIER